MGVNSRKGIWGNSNNNNKTNGTLEVRVVPWISETPGIIVWLGVEGLQGRRQSPWEGSGPVYLAQLTGLICFADWLRCRNLAWDLETAQLEG